ncbi:translation initiation factor eif-2b subunit beta [Plakobranchus ocellatus]|uniref:Translation initiation factor eIF2B subunit beta n=1 Tax=Plakobranchus ocellatus TaxID=259542 RepID=A0AAV4D4K0_9GAST|nr:translation initiation factor eif-2b subunit beta [Plakobranchus ocellatus]
MPGGEGDKASDLKERIEAFVYKMKKGNLTRSCDVAINTIDLLIRIISQAKFSNARELLKHVRAEGSYLQAGDPSENIIGNMIRRVLKIIREEYRAILSQDAGGEATIKFEDVSIAESKEDDYAKPTPNLKAFVIEAISELKTEIEGGAKNIADLAPNYINENDIILTIGRSRTVEAFFKHAALKKIKFQVLVSECAPFFHGHEMAKNLAEAKINTTLITECQIGTIMPRVNKVIIGTHSFMANGGLKAVTGTNILALLAKEHNKHVIVCSSLYKLSPLFHSTLKHASFNKFASPNELLDYEDAELLSKVEVIAPIFDYVPPDLVSMVVSNNGPQSVSYVYRLVKDYYHPDDVDL